LYLHGEMPELAEGARLEIVCTPKRCTEGSNPSLSAIYFVGGLHLLGMKEILLLHSFSYLRKDK
jgi:hypothetical protein